MKVKNKVILVTGGGNGMGRSLVLNLLKKEATVIAIDINEEGLKETTSLAAAYKHALTTYKLDITDRTAVEAFVAEMVAGFKGIDGIINNAGIIQPFVKLNELSFEAIERVFNINLYGTLNMIKTLLPHLLSRPEAHIVNISSMGGFLPVPGQTIYGASKAAIKLLTEGLSSELSNTGVRVTVVFPGAIKTDIMKNSGLSNAPSAEDAKGMKITTPDEAAKLIIDGMEANRYRVLVGMDSKFMDFVYRVSPKRAAGFINKKIQSYLS